MPPLAGMYTKLEPGNMAERERSDAAANEKQPSSLCFCSAKKTVHVHCTCNSCNGKPVNYRTQISHLEIERNFEAANAVDSPVEAANYAVDSPGTCAF